ncbi:MAG: hypothetical protein Q9220_004997 [cf. Caloplaca sp. 1 TL-2023]
MHGVKSSDEALLQALRENAISHQIILSKVDRVLYNTKGRAPSPSMLLKKTTHLQSLFQSLRDRLDAMDVTGPKPLGEILACSTMPLREKVKDAGINNLRWSILAATGLNEVRKSSPIFDTDTTKNLAPEQMLAASSSS